MAERCAQRSGSPRDRKCRGAGGSIGVGRVARAAPDGYTFDIGQWDTHVGRITTSSTTTSKKILSRSRLFRTIPSLWSLKNSCGGVRFPLVAGMRKIQARSTCVNQNAAANVTGVIFENLPRRRCSSFPYRAQARDDRPYLRYGGSAGGAGCGGAAANPRRQDQGARQSLGDALGLDAGYSDRGRDRRARPLYVRLVRLPGAKGHAEGRHRQTQRRPRWKRWPTPRSRSGLPNWGSTSRPARSKRRKDWPPSRRPRSKNGGRSSRPPGSACRRSNCAHYG